MFWFGWSQIIYYNFINPCVWKDLKIVIAKNPVYPVCTVWLNGIGLLKHSKFTEKPNVYSNKILEMNALHHMVHEQSREMPDDALV